MSKSTPQLTFNKKEAMLKALQGNFGRVSKAAAAAQITKQTHYNWYKNDEEYRHSVDNIKFEGFEEFGDLVFSAVIDKLKEGNTAVVNKCFQTVFADWVGQMERGSPYKPRIITTIKYIDKPAPPAIPDKLK
jgi:hypothetical protein